MGWQELGSADPGGISFYGKVWAWLAGLLVAGQHGLQGQPIPQVTSYLVDILWQFCFLQRGSFAKQITLLSAAAAPAPMCSDVVILVGRSLDIATCVSA